MDDPNRETWLQEQIENWRRFLRRRRRDPALHAPREAELRAEFAALVRVGLANDEAFGVALKRLGVRDSMVAAFAREQVERDGSPLASNAFARSPEQAGVSARREALVAFGLAVLAAMAIKAPALFGVSLQENEGFYFRNAGLFVLPGVTAYFAWKRRLAPRTLGWLAGAFVVAGVFANLSGFGASPEFGPLTGAHLPIALLLPVGVAYAGGRWREVAARLEFVRFSGDLFIHYVLIALGGGVLCAFMALTFRSLGIDLEPFFEAWLLPCGATGAVVIASWLGEAKRNVIESMAPVLTRLFTPLFAAMLIAFLVALAWSGRGLAVQRELLIGFDLLLVVVLGLVLYSISARDPHAPPGVFDGLQVLLVMSALLADAAALWAIAMRIGDFGLSPNRVAALGENILLLIHLTGAAALYFRFLIGRGSFASLERWQTGYLPVYVAWAAIVVVLFPIVFRFV